MRAATSLLLSALLMAMGAASPALGLPTTLPVGPDGVVVDAVVVHAVPCADLVDVAGALGVDAVVAIHADEAAPLAVAASMVEGTVGGVLGATCEELDEGMALRVGLLPADAVDLDVADLPGWLEVQPGSARSWGATLAPMATPTSYERGIADGVAMAVDQPSSILTFGTVHVPIALPHQGGDCIYPGGNPLTGDAGYLPGCPSATGEAETASFTLTPVNVVVPQSSATTWVMSMETRIDPGTYGVGLGFSGATIDVTTYAGIAAALPDVPAAS